MSKKVTIIGEFRFPSGGPGSTRVLGLGKMLKTLNYEVTFIGKYWENDKSNFHQGAISGFNYFNVYVPNARKISRILNVVKASNNALKILEKIEKPDIIIYYGTTNRYLLPLLRYCKKNKIKLVVDVVEWYNYSHLAGGKYGPVALDTHYALTKIIPKCDGIIVISSFLEKYYSAKNKKTIRIPQIFDSEEAKWDTRAGNSFDSNYLNLIYTGVPGKKDLIGTAIIGLKKLTDQKHKVKLHLFGPTKENIKLLLRENKNLINELKENLIFHGRVNQNNIPENLAKADFSVLIRPNERFANAGFPTKVVESFAAGIPVICNLTSDLGLYIKDEVNGFIMTDYSVDSFIQSVKRALLISGSKKAEMKVAAKLQAKKFFDYNNYTEALDNFIKTI